MITVSLYNEEEREIVLGALETYSKACIDKAVDNAEGRQELFQQSVLSTCIKARVKTAKEKCMTKRQFLAELETFIGRIEDGEIFDDIEMDEGIDVSSVLSMIAAVIQ